ncbi:hypothetical protein GT037_004159 [Alternaria burnsii]|uniref:Heterokaryon incompatibility domain-containing protein n=1 Tax=Alternaria burnsii TaxID=1187904 RepID=A0A8H7B9W3_9PLEO|nr:uncharacterized protein GT037_004159 [Alternaria burnsii]KAF7677300.1 hypothetical protein GT037_004159 [Alternaria burnsii]CAI9634610.1 unnamed protein product [Alternaria burnsii]
MLDYLRNLRASCRRQAKLVAPARRATSRPNHDTSVLPNITETSQAVVPRPPESPLRSRPEEPGCLLPNLSAHVYEPIDSENGEIRLVELLPGCYDDVIQLNLHMKNLSDKPSYEALSYAWGTTPSSNRAIINGCLIPVRESLDQGLRRLRLGDQPRTLWIDALCINQSDVRERSHQVQQMCRIYKSAQQVVVWLGEWPDVDTCLDPEECQRLWLRNLDDWSLLSTRRVTPSKQKRKAISMQLTPVSEHLCQHVVEISKLPWFRRLWIIQEFILSFIHPKVLLGNYVTSSANFFAAITRCLEIMLRISASPESERRQVKQLYTHLTMLQDLAQCFHAYSGISLYTTLMMTRYAMATDPRDRIYGLLGIIKYRVAEPIVPDYSKGWPQVLAEATIVMIAEDGLFPYMNGGFAFPLVDGSQERYRTSSWVLDLSQLTHDNDEFSRMSNRINNESHRLISEGVERRRKSLRLSNDSRTLYKHGLYIGTIIGTYTFTANTGIFGLWSGVTAIDPAAGLHDFYHEVLQPKGITPKCLLEALDAKLIYHGSLAEFTSSLSGHRDEFVPVFRAHDLDRHKFAVFLTDRGDVGLTWLHNTVDIRADDILVALFERQMPFVLRPIPGHLGLKTYRMVNVAYITERSREYVHYMDGHMQKKFNEDPHDWVFDAAEGCAEYAIV